MHQPDPAHATIRNYNLRNSTKNVPLLRHKLTLRTQTYLRSSYPGCGRRRVAEDVSAFGQHRKFPPHARKTSGTQGTVVPSFHPKVTFRVERSDDRKCVCSQATTQRNLIKKTVCYIYSGAKLLNKHPEEVRSCETFVSLKRQSKSSGIWLATRSPIISCEY